MERNRYRQKESESLAYASTEPEGSDMRGFKDIPWRMRDGALTCIGGCLSAGLWVRSTVSDIAWYINDLRSDTTSDPEGIN